ncbi:hypothetical protein DYB25_007397 [Aphanomyces astaci]|uniref:Uncharacterized protein n=1 Tax=Aphanomyces astaci TaxID=112090 RepID=A0A396ZU07_APHAT|nr:hypothetical protein DYB25_007397 [Aphanomyces astaci]
MTPSQEAAYWSDYGISRFSTQWQNFKRIGLVETFEITTPFQVSYSFTLKSSTGAIHVDKSASFKLYWGLANDFVAVRSNVSSIAGHMQTIITADKPLVDLINSVQSVEFMSTWSNSSRHFSAGNIICDYTSSPGAADRTVKGSFTSDGDCSGVKSMVIYASRMQILFAALAWHIQWPHEALDIQFICALNANACVDDLTNTLLWATAVTGNDGDMTLQSAVQDVVVTAGNVSMIQVEAKSRQLLLLTLFGSKSIAYTGWMLLYEWVVGVREVVAFAGDANV